MLYEVKRILISIQNELALMVGIIAHIYREEEFNFRFFISLSIQSILVAFYLIPPILVRMNIDPNSDIAIAFYALSPMFAVQILGVIAVVVPDIARRKLLKFFGVRRLHGTDETDDVR